MKYKFLTLNHSAKQPTFKLAALTLSLMGMLSGMNAFALDLNQANFDIVAGRVDGNEKGIAGANTNIELALKRVEGVETNVGIALNQIKGLEGKVNGIGANVDIALDRINGNFEQLKVLDTNINNAQEAATAQILAAQNAMDTKLNESQAVLNDNLNKAQKQLGDDINNTIKTFHERCDYLQEHKADKFTIVGEDDIVVTHDETDNSYHISMNNGPDGLVGKVDRNTARIDDLDKDMKKTGAMAAAMAALKPLEYDENRKFAASAGLGHYHGNQALAVGLFYHPTRNVMFNAGLSSTGGSDTMLNAGVTMSLGKRQANTMKEAMLEDEVKVLRRQVSELREAVAELTRVAR